MRSMFFLATIASLMIASCDTPQPDEATIDSWNDVRSKWGDSKHCDSSSDDARDAMDIYREHSDSNTSNHIAHFQIILSNVTVHADGTQSWTYAITKTGDGRDHKDLSHFGLILPCSESQYSDLHGATVGPDPSAEQCIGNKETVKWDRGVSSGETVYYTITTDKAYEVGTVKGLVKYGRSCDTGKLPGPDCTHPVGGGSTDPGTGGGSDPGTGGGSHDGCPSWIDTLQLNISIDYYGHHGLASNGYVLYYLGETMYGHLSICNPTSNTVDKLKVTAIQELYQHANGTTCSPGCSLGCGNPVQVWTDVVIAPNDCLVLTNSFQTSTACPVGNYQTHIVVTRQADSGCPSGALIFDEDQVGIYDPPSDEG